VIISIAEYWHLRSAGQDFKEFLRSAPEVDLEISRSAQPARRVEAGEE
jgi:hypothetical protein